MARRLNASEKDFAANFAALAQGSRETDEDVGRAVKDIIADVRANGDAALIQLSRRFDRVELTPETMRVSPDEIAKADRDAPEDVKQALQLAARRIESYHRRQLPKDESFTDETGATLGWRWRPLSSVGLYVPGGTASYPSSVLMNAVPAHVAGVARVVMVTPASGGAVNPLTLVAAKIAGVSEIYRVGGAQAFAALAHGTATISPVDKIVGPGNAYVAAAKREVFGRVGIDFIAGPSEILVVADGANDPAWIAADLLSQAEHDASSQSILVTDDAAFADMVAGRSTASSRCFPRRDIAARALAWIMAPSSWSRRLPMPPRSSTASRRSISNLPSPIRSSVFARVRQCRRGLPRPPHARSDRRLHRRAEPCASDLAHGAVFLRPLGARFPETNDGACRCDADAARQAWAAGPYARRSRRALGPCPLDLHPPEPNKSGEHPRCEIALPDRQRRGSRWIGRHSPEDRARQSAIAIHDLSLRIISGRQVRQAGPSSHPHHRGQAGSSSTSADARASTVAAHVLSLTPLAPRAQGLSSGLRELLRGDLSAPSPGAHRIDRHGPPRPA